MGADRISIRSRLRTDVVLGAMRAAFLEPNGALSRAWPVAVLMLACLSCQRKSPTTPTIPLTPAPLSIVCPANLVVRATAPASVVFTAPIVSGDGASGAICSPTSGSSFGYGLTTVSCVASSPVATPPRCDFSVRVQEASPALALRFLAFGDSLTEGEVAAPRLSLQVLLPEKSYPAVLGKKMRAAYPEQSVSIFNAGVSGESATCGQPQTRSCDDPQASEQRLVDRLDADRFDALLLMEGTNDINGGVSLDALRNSLSADIRRARQRGVSFIFLATLPPQVPGTPIGRGSHPDDVIGANDVIRDLARAEGVTLVDVFAAVEPQLLQTVGDDGLHLTEYGYEVVAGTFFEAIRSSFAANASSVTLSMPTRVQPRADRRPD